MNNTEIQQRYLIGSETEFGVFSDPSLHELDLLYAYSDDSNPINQHLYEAIGAINGFLPNGGRFYFDVFMDEDNKSIGYGCPEYCTPECSSTKEIAVYEIAGEDIGYLAMSALKQAGLIRSFQANKRSANGIGKGNTRAAHENIQIPQEILQSETFVPTMAGYLATRSILTGAGMVRGAEFWVAQKMPFISALKGTDTVVDKPLVMLNRHGTKGVDTEIFPNSIRYESISGDANMSPWAIRIKHGMNMLIMAALEAGLDMRDLAPKNPLGAAHIVARDDALTQKFRLQEGGRMSAIEWQSELWGRVIEILEDNYELPDDLKWVIREIEQALSELVTNPERAAQRGVEWLKRQAFIDRACDDTKKGVKKREDADYHWDVLGPYGVASALRVRGWAGYVLLRREVEKAKHTPPSLERAQKRGMFVAGSRPSEVKSIDWHKWAAKPRLFH